MGQLQPTGCDSPSASTSRFPLRQCLRKGCVQQFVPRRWNQRYCREPECLQQLSRWQAAKRQQRRRARAEVRRQQAEAQRQRRQRHRSEAGDRQTEPAAEPPAASRPRALSRSKKNPHDFCDRPGCFEPRRPSGRAPARYCGDACRQAVQRVRDRERKWKRRKQQAAAAARRVTPHLPQRERKPAAGQAGTNAIVRVAPRSTHPVRHYRDGAPRALSSRETHPEVPTHDQETSAGRGSRAPPSA
jgi:hypothetical protein